MGACATAFVSKADSLQGPSNSRPQGGSIYVYVPRSITNTSTNMLTLTLSLISFKLTDFTQCFQAGGHPVIHLQR